ncbi:MAG: amidohydrolase family protein, partial [Planctomycetota bacterium]|nr:amidohydrolase family protein [Planctomycetota bacterium]
RSGRIVQLGKRIDIDKNTPGLMIIDVPGSLTPGLIDGGSGLGIDGRRADEFREMTPGLPVLLGADLDTIERRRALQSGVTAALITPGDRNVIGGLAAVIKTNGDNLSEAVLDGASSLSMCLTQMASSGNRTLRSGRPSTYLYRIPTTRMGTVFLARRALLVSVPGGWDSSKAVGDLKDMLTTSEREVVREVLAGKRTLRIRAQARYEILTALRIAGEFGLQVQIEGAREAIHLVSLLKEKKASVFLAANERWSGRELEANLNLSARLPAELHKAGVPFAFYSDSASAVAGLRDRVTWCIRRGLPESAALEALTLGAARMLGVSKRLGSIEPGKDADLVAFGGASPFDARSAVLWVMVDGKIVADPFQGEKPVERPRAKINKRRSLVPQGDF